MPSTRKLDYWSTGATVHAILADEYTAWMLHVYDIIRKDYFEYLESVDSDSDNNNNINNNNNAHSQIVS